MLKLAVGLMFAVITSAVLQADEPPTKAEYERDLVLEVKRLSPKTIQAGQHLMLSMALKNTSATNTYPVVKPGDGSSVGWREPHVFFTVQRKTKAGDWEEAPKARFARCGVYDPDWKKDITRLAPGERLELKDWLGAPSYFFEFQEPGTYRVVLHYRFQGGATHKGIWPAIAQKAGDIPAFEIGSEPVEIEVVRPLDVIVKPKAALKVHTKTKLSDLLDIQLVNRTDEPMEITLPTLSAEARLYLEVEGQFGGWRPKLDQQQTKNDIKRILKPGERISILGEEELTNGLDGTWEYPVEDVIKLRAAFNTSTWRGGATIKSDWVEIKAEK